MKLKELLNCCQNTYMRGRSFQYNPLFTCTLVFSDRSDNLLESDYKLKADYTDDDSYLMKYKDREVKYWFSEGINDLYVEIEGHY